MAKTIRNLLGLNDVMRDFLAPRPPVVMSPELAEARAVLDRFPAMALGAYPSEAMYRKAMERCTLYGEGWVTLPKPRIRAYPINGFRFWQCEAGGCCMVGSTPDQAYDNWAHAFERNMKTA